MVMDRGDDFADLMERARSGDPAAVRDFLDRFEEVRAMVRARLPRKLRPRFDSGDFVQAVWKSFFADSDAPRPAFENEAHLRGFLGAVVRNKVQEQHRRLTRTAKHNLAREEPLYIARGDREVAREVASPDPSPSERVQADDRLEQLTAGFGPREIEVLSLRRQGLTYAELAERTGIHERSVRRIIELFRARLEGRV
jgi:RNA polymerase sigma factor (sigma-70 family)